MRIVDNMLFDNFLYNINRVNEQMFKTTTQMSSGKRLINLSTDPIALSETLSLKDINSRFEQYSTNINASSGILDAEDTALSTSDNLIQQMGSLLIEGANATNDKSSRLAIAQQLDAIKSEIKSSANTVFEGKYLFSGYKTNTAPIQTQTQSAAITNKDGTDIEIETAENFKDINQLQSGNYTIHIEGNRLWLSAPDSTIKIPIDSNSKDESNVGGNELSTSIDVLSKEGQWIDTGRGIKVKLPSDLSGTHKIGITYQAGGDDIYAGDDNSKKAEYSDNLSSSITTTAKEIYKAQNRTIKNNNAMIDITTNDPVVPQTKLTDIRLMSALKDVSLETGDNININGTDHNGNLIQGSFGVASNSTLNDFMNAIKKLDSTEVLENNKTLQAGDSLATSGTKLSSLGITSNIIFSGAKYGGSAVTSTFTMTTSATLGNLASFISSNFDVTATIAHGKIEVEDSSPGKSDLSIRAQTTSGNPILGMFNATSIGGSGGLEDTADLFIKDGHLYIEDKRAGKSKLNLSFNVTKNVSGTAEPVPKPNILGLFNVIQEGGGVDVFRALSDASKALGDPDSYSQISTPTSWGEGSTRIPTISGKYLGGINDKWTVDVTQGSDLSNAGDEAKLSVNGENSPTGNNKIADIDITKTDSGYDIKVFNKDGVLITNYKNATDLSNIVIETKNVDSSFNSEGVNGEAGVTLNLSSAGKLVDGDSFSFNVSNALEDSIAKSKDILDQILHSRAIVGARANRFKLAKDRITTTQVSNKKSISELEDANMAQVFSDYQKEQIIMKATLNFGSKLSQNNLFNYI